MSIRVSLQLERKRSKHSIHSVFHIKENEKCYLIIRRAEEEIEKCLLKAFAEAWSKVVFIFTKLMSRLTYNRVNHIETWDLIFWGTLKRKTS